jgi:hypothetical protein
MVFLLKDEPIQAGAEDLKGSLVELPGENICLQVFSVLNEGRALPLDRDLLMGDPVSEEVCQGLGTSLQIPPTLAILIDSLIV